MVLIFAVQFAVLLLQVFMRYVLVRPISWAEELAVHILVWLTFLGAAYGVRHGTHPRVSMLAGLEARRVGWLAAIQTLVPALVLVAMAGAGAALAYTNRETLSPTTRIPEWILYGAMPVGALLMLMEMFVPSRLSGRAADPTVESGE